MRRYYLSYNNGLELKVHSSGFKKMSYSSLRVIKQDVNLWLELLCHVDSPETTTVKKHVFYV